MNARPAEHRLAEPIWRDGRREAASGAVWRRRSGCVGTAVGGAIAAIVGLSFVITGIGGIRYRFQLMWHSDHGDNPHFAPSPVDFFIIPIAALFVIVPVGFAVFGLWYAIADRRQRKMRRAFTHDKSTLGLDVSSFGVVAGAVKRPDYADYEGDMIEAPIKRLLFQPTAAPYEFHILAYVTEGLWIETGCVDGDPSWQQRHRLAWLTMRIEGTRMGIVGITPIPVEAVRKAYDDRSAVNLPIFAYPTDERTEIWGDDILVFGTAAPR